MLSVKALSHAERCLGQCRHMLNAVRYSAERRQESADQDSTEPMGQRIITKYFVFELGQ